MVGKKIHFSTNMRETKTIHDLKVKISTGFFPEFEIFPYEQLIIFRGRELFDEVELSDVFVPSGNDIVLHVVKKTNDFSNVKPARS